MKVYVVNSFEYNEEDNSYSTYGGIEGVWVDRYHASQWIDQEKLRDSDLGFDYHYFIEEFSL